MTYFYKNIYFIIDVIYHDYLVSSVSIALLATDRTVQGWDPGGSENYRAVHSGPKAYPASYVMGTESFSGKAAGAWC
jgi:hypothetical protein